MSVVVVLAVAAVGHTQRMETVIKKDGQTINISVPERPVTIPKDIVKVEAPKPAETDWLLEIVKALVPSVLAFGAAWFGARAGKETALEALRQSSQLQKEAAQEAFDTERHSQRVDALTSLASQVFEIGQSVFNQAYYTRRAGRTAQERARASQDDKNRLEEFRAEFSKQLVRVLEISERYGSMPDGVPYREKYLAEYIKKFIKQSQEASKGSAEDRDEYNKQTNTLLADIRALRRYEDAVYSGKSKGTQTKVEIPELKWIAREKIAQPQDQVVALPDPPS